MKRIRFKAVVLGLTVVTLLAILNVIFKPFHAIESGVMVQVPAEASPIPDMVGVKTKTFDGTTVYALIPAAAPFMPLTIKAGARPDGDASQLVGKSFYEFSNLPQFDVTAVVDAKVNVKNVVECDPKLLECADIFFERLDKHRISFTVRSGQFYALDPIQNVLN